MITKRKKSRKKFYSLVIKAHVHYTFHSYAHVLFDFFIKMLIFIYFKLFYSFDTCSYFYENQIVKIKPSINSSRIQEFQIDDFSYYFQLCGEISNKSLPYEVNSSYKTQLYKCIPYESLCLPFIHTKFPEIFSVSGKSIILTGYFDGEAEDTVQIITKYEFDIYTDVAPPMPKKGPTPTPSYKPDPHSIIFTQNSTHFVAFDLSWYNNSTFQGSIPFTVDQRRGLLYYQFSPWELKDCPRGYKCGGSNQANVYACWFDYDAGKYCHQIGDKRIYVYTSELDTGYRIQYGGAFDIKVEMRISCDKSIPEEPLFSFDNTFSSYNRAMTGPEFSFNVSSSSACPKAFEIPPRYTPFPIPTQTPNPSYNPLLSLVDENDDGVIDFHLDRLNFSTPVIALKHNESYQRPMFHISPTQQIQCPDNYLCEGMDIGNIWKCTTNQENNYCFTVGDLRYGLEMTLVKDEVVRVTYKGGINNYTTQITYFCDNSENDESSFFYNDNYGDIGIEEDYPLIKFFGRTKEACRVPVPPSEFSSGGEVSCLIFTILYLLFTTYFFIGVLVYYFKDRTGKFPNAGFWTTFFEYVKIGATSCCKKQNTPQLSNSQNYDALN